MATTLYFGTLRALQNIVSTIVEVDTKMTELKRVMDSNTNFNQFLSDSISLSTELSRNLNDVLDIANEFARQGYTSQETLDLTKVAGMLQNISDLTPEQSLDALISGMKNFNITAQESIHIADALNETDNQYSITTQQLATSLFKASSTAKAYGVTMESLIGMTTAIGETTREAGTVIGNSLKSIFSRLETSKQSIEALKDVGIEVKTSTGEMRSATDVLNDLGIQWSNLTAEQQQNLGVVIAGRQQLSRFFALMQNWQTAIAATTTATNSQNSALIENAKYQDSLQARISRLNTAWKQLALEIGNAVVTDSLINIVHSLTALANVASEAVDKFGVLPFVFGSVGTAITLLSTRLKGLVVDLLFATNTERALILQTEELSLALKGLAASTLIGAIFAAIGFAIEKLIGYYGRLRQEQEKQKQQTKELVDSYKANKEEVSGLVDEYEKMSSQVASGDLSKSDKEYLDIQTKLGNILPTTIDYVSKSGQVHLKTSESIQKEIDSLKELSKLDSQKFVEDFSSKLSALNDKILATQSSIKKYNLEVSSTPSSFNTGGSNPVEFKKTPLTTDDKLNNVVKEQEYQAQLNDRVNLFKQLSSEYQNFLGVQNTLTKADQTYIDTLIENNKVQLASKKGQKDVESQVKALIVTYSQLRDVFGSGVDFSHLFEGMSPEQVASVSTLLKGFKSGGESVQEFTKLLERNGFTTQQVINITNALTQAKKENKSATDAQAQAQDTLNKILDGSLSVEDALAQSVLGYTKESIDQNSKLIEVYAGLSKAKNLDANESALLTQVYDELKARFPDLVKGHEVSVDALYGEANAQNVLYQAVVASANGQLDAEHQKTLGMAQELMNQKKIVEEQIKLYQKGLDAYVASQMAQNNGSLSMNGAMMANYRRIQQLQDQVDSVIIPKIQKAAISLGKYLNISPTFKTPDWNYDTSGTKGSKSSKGSSTADTQAVNKYQTDAFSKSLADLELQLKQSQARLDDYDKTSVDYRNELNHQIDLIKKEESLTTKQISTLEKRNDALNRQLKAMGDYNKLSNKQKQSYNDIAKAIDDNINKIDDLKGAMVDYGEKTQDIQNQVLDSFSAIEDVIVNNINKAMQQSDDYYDGQIKKLQEQLDLLDQQYEKEDRIAKLRDIQNQIDTAKADKRFEYINAQGQVELTYDKGKVSDLEKQQDDLIQQYNREDAKKAIQDQIDRLQKAKDDQHAIYEQQITDAKEFWDTIVKGVQDGSISFSDAMNTFFGSSLDDLTKFAGDVSKQADIIKGLFADLGNLSVNASKYGTGMNPGDKVDPQKAKEANLHIKNDPEFRKSEIDRAKAIIYNRLKAGLDVSRQEDYLHYLQSFHVGGIVGNSPSSLTQIADKVLNTKLQPNEQVIKVLKGELLSPAANIAQNFIPNLRMIASNLVRQPIPVSADNHYHFNNLTIKSNNMTEFIRDIHFLASSKRT